MDNNTQLTLILTVDQVNLVLHALSKLPYETVSGLIGVVTNQAQAEVQRLKEIADGPVKEQDALPPSKPE